MHIVGHIGFTLGAATLLQKMRNWPPFKRWQLVWLALVALLPDILDRSLHLLLPNYPEHMIFHAMPIYLVVVPLLWMFHRKVAACGGIMAFNAALDIVNVDPRALFFPLFGWFDWSMTGRPLIEPYMNRLPSFLAAMNRTGHYLIFEVAGLLMIIWAARSAARSNNCNLSV